MQLPAEPGTYEIRVTRADEFSRCARSNRRQTGQTRPARRWSSSGLYAQEKNDDLKERPVAETEVQQRNLADYDRALGTEGVA